MKRSLFILLGCCVAGALYSQGALQLRSGAFLRATGGTYLILNNMGLVNNGTLSQPGTGSSIKLTGSANASISGSGTTDLTQLELALAGHRLDLSTNITVASSVSFTSGLLNLNNSVIDLGTTGSLSGESESNRAYTTGSGSIVRVATLNAPSSANPGNLGAIITSAANLGATTIRRGHAQQMSTGGGPSILRYYDISPANNTGLNATLRFTYFDAELNGLDESMLFQWKSSDNGATWISMGADVRNTSLNYVEKSGLNDFSRWTLARSLIALPVQYTLFNAQCSGNGIRISWRTEESQISRYAVQKSMDGLTWTTVSTAAASGAGSRLYSYEDAGGTEAFYRIAAYSLTGATEFSSVLKASCGLPSLFAVYPNPIVSGTTAVRLYTPSDALVRLALYDAKGALVLISERSVPAGNNVLPFSAGQLASGTYVLNVTWNGMTKTVRLVKKD